MSQTINDNITIRQQLLLTNIIKSVYIKHNIKSVLIHPTGSIVCVDSDNIVNCEIPSSLSIMYINIIEEIGKGMWQDNIIAGIIALMFYSWKIKNIHPIDFINNLLDLK